MNNLSWMPGLNACLNATSAVLLFAGWVFVQRNIAAHRFCMAAAFLVSSVFLASYLYYHFHAGSTRYPGTGILRGVYFIILLSHAILAVVIVPMILVTFTRALRGDFLRHARLARWTLPLWMYVSVTGVIIYWMLYRM